MTLQLSEHQAAIAEHLVADGEAIKLEASWKEALHGEFNSAYMQDLKAFLKREYSQGATIYPRGSEFFAALNLTPIPSTKVVILGQDPYHGPGQAHGLCFSVRQDVAIPPSLLNIYKELRSDLGLPIPEHGHLEGWARQGVLLLNSVLSVRAHLAGSHANKGWERFTDRIIAILNSQREHLVFVLWGAYAQKKGQLIDRQRHLVLTSAHPSPLSASRGFFGSKPFSKINNYLEQHGAQPIDWNLSRKH